MAKIAILGYAKQGMSAYEYWKSLGDDVTICDSRKDIQLPSGAKSKLGPDYLNDLDSFDLIVRAAPSIHPREIIAANSEAIAHKITSNTNEFFRVCPSKNIIGVTGTKGKGTTCTLVAKMLEAAGKKVHLGGNIGTPPLDLLKAGIGADDWVVLELANFQLIDLKYSPNIAVCLMVVAEHLDWHASMEEYIEAKRQLFVHQKSDDIAIYFADNENPQKIVEVSSGQKIPYFAKPGAHIENNEVKIDGQVICKTSELKLLGKHNWQNVCAAVTAVWQITQDVDAIKSVLTSFTGLEHRLEFVRELDGVKYYNDSFAVTPDAAMAALEAIPGSKVLIAGGFDRNLPLSHFAQAIKDNEGQLRMVLLIGASAKRLAKELETVGFKNFFISEAKSMPQIIQVVQAKADKSGAIVLSPGFPSFDMFKNYEERGLKYKEAVKNL